MGLAPISDRAALDFQTGFTERQGFYLSCSPERGVAGPVLLG